MAGSDAASTRISVMSSIPHGGGGRGVTASNWLTGMARYRYPASLVAAASRRSSHEHRADRQSTGSEEEPPRQSREHGHRTSSKKLFALNEIGQSVMAIRNEMLDLCLKMVKRNWLYCLSTGGVDNRRC